MINPIEWFRKNKVKEVTIEDIDKKLDQIISEKPEKKDENLQKRLILTNDTLICIVNGITLNKSNCTQEDLQKVREMTTESQILEFFFSKEKVQELQKEKEDRKESELLQIAMKTLKNSGEFEVEGNSVYLKGIKRSLPPLLVTEFTRILEIHKDYLEVSLQFISLKRFWMWCCLNPVPEVAESLYEFLKRGDFKITRDGMFLAYRRICPVGEDDKSLTQFISSSYVKVKTIWKKNPRNFEVYKSDDFEGYKLTDNIGTNSFQGRNHVVVGNLCELYQNLGNVQGNLFTDSYTKSYKIKIGEPVVMARSECNFTNADCGYGGLHFCSKLYDYSGYGTQPVIVLINPYNVVGIGTDKGRTCEYLPIMTLSEEEARTILGESDFDTTELEEYYALEQLKELEERVKSDYATEIGKHEFHIPEITKDEVKMAIKSLEEIKKEVEGRTISF